MILLERLLKWKISKLRKQNIIILARCPKIMLPCLPECHQLEQIQVVFSKCLKLLNYIQERVILNIKASMRSSQECLPITRANNSRSETLHHKCSEVDRLEPQLLSNTNNLDRTVAISSFQLALELIRIKWPLEASLGMVQRKFSRLKFIRSSKNKHSSAGLSGSLLQRPGTAPKRPASPGASLQSSNKNNDFSFGLLSAGLTGKSKILILQLCYRKWIAKAKFCPWKKSSSQQQSLFSLVKSDSSREKERKES